MTGETPTISKFNTLRRRTGRMGKSSCAIFSHTQGLLSKTTFAKALRLVGTALSELFPARTGRTDRQAWYRTPSARKKRNLRQKPANSVASTPKTAGTEQLPRQLTMSASRKVSATHDSSLTMSLCAVTHSTGCASHKASSLQPLTLATLRSLKSTYVQLQKSYRSRIDIQ